MSEERAKQLAMIYQAIEDCDRDFAAERADYKFRRESLIKSAYELRRSILTGQMSIVDAIRQNLPEIERELNKNSPDSKVTLGVSGD